MKNLVVTVLGFLFAAPSVWAASPKCEFPAAVYAGEGAMRNFADDEVRTYQVKTEFSGKEIKSVYKIGGETTLTLVMRLSIEGDTCVMSVEADGQVTNDAGKCGEHGCSYRLKHDDLRLEENFMLQGGELYRIGFRVHPSRGDNGIVSWSEKLPKVK